MGQVGFTLLLFILKGFMSNFFTPPSGWGISNTVPFFFLFFFGGHLPQTSNTCRVFFIFSSYLGWLFYILHHRGWTTTAGSNAPGTFLVIIILIKSTHRLLFNIIV